MKTPLSFSDTDCEFALGFRDADCEVTLGFSEKIQAIKGPFYDGEYEVTPSTEEQILKTANKSLNEDIKVKNIPYFEVSNNAGGITVTIGEE